MARKISEWEQHAPQKFNFTSFRLSNGMVIAAQGICNRTGLIVRYNENGEAYQYRKGTRVPEYDIRW